MKFEYKKVIKKNRLGSIKAAGNHVAYLWTNQVRKRWYLNHEPLEDGYDFVHFIDSKEAIIRNIENYSTVVLNLQTKEKRILDNIEGIRVVGSDKIIGNILINEERKRIIADFFTGEILYKIPQYWNFLGEFAGLLFVQEVEDTTDHTTWKNHTLTAIDINKGGIKWKLKISDVNKVYDKEHIIKQVLGIYGNDVLIHVLWGGIVAINIETGKISWQIIHLDENQSKISHVGNYGLRNPTLINAYIFHLLDDKIYYLFNRQFGVIDLKTQKAVIRLDLGDYLADQLDLTVTDSKYTREILKDIPAFRGGDLLIDRHIIAPVCDRGSAACPFIVAFNIDSENIDWKYQKKKRYGWMKNLVYSGSKFLYCTGSKYELHIFERTE